MKVGKKGSGASSFESKMDMTPLIDIIFQLILFLVLTCQITVQAEELELPFALEGKEQEDLGEGERPPLLVNIILDSKGPYRSGQIVFNRKKLGNDMEGLKKELEREVSYDGEPAPYGLGRGYETGPGGRRLSKLVVLLRADKSVRAEYIRTVFMACQEVGIYKIRVSSTAPRQP